MTITYCCWPHQERLEPFPEYVLFRSHFRNIWLSPLTTWEEGIHYFSSLGITNLAETSGTWDPKSFIKGHTETFHTHCNQITKPISASISRDCCPFNKPPSYPLVIQPAHLVLSTSTYGYRGKRSCQTSNGLSLSERICQSSCAVWKTLIKI